MKTLQQENGKSVAKYMKHQDKEEEPINTALADALKKLNLK